MQVKITCLDHIYQLQSHTINLIKRNSTYKIALTQIAHIINNIQSNQSTAAPSVATASKPTNEMQTFLAAITNLSHPTPLVVANSKTKMQQILALLTAKGGLEITGTSGGGNQNNNNNNNNNNNHNCKQKISVKPNPRYKFYCWSNGINLTHDSCGCRNKFPGYQDGTAYTNQMGRYQINALC